MSETGNGSNKTSSKNKNQNNNYSNTLKSVTNNNPRYYSFLIVKEFLSKPANFNRTASSILEKSGLNGLDRRFAYQISKGTIRFIYLIDYAAELFSGVKIGRIEESVLNILRIAFYQLIFMDRVPQYAAVNESVKLAKEVSGPRSSMFINAVLRNTTKTGNIYSYIKDKIKNSRLPVNHQLSIRQSYPVWILKEWEKLYSIEKIEKLCECLNREPYIFARVNKVKISKQELEDIFHKSGIKTLDFTMVEPFINIQNKNYSKEEIPENDLPKEILSDTLVLDSSQGLEDIPGFNEGFFSIQDLSSQIAIKYVFEPCKKERILDICGAPGGKALYCSEITRCDSEICSVDINREKLNIFEKNIKRLGLYNIDLLEADASKDDFLQYKGKPSEFYYGYFDRIFIDSPCSAFGTIAKNPDVKYLRQNADIEKLAALSLSILSNSARYLKKGGILVFYTCTLSIRENQGTINQFLEINKGKFMLEPLKNIALVFAKQGIKEFDTLISKNAAMLEIMPFYFNSEGGFICKIKKTG